MIATIVLRLPLPDEGVTPEDVATLLKAVATLGFSTAVQGPKPYANEAGISTEGLTAAVLDAKLRRGRDERY